MSPDEMDTGVCPETQPHMDVVAAAGMTHILLLMPLMKGLSGWDQYPSGGKSALESLAPR